MSSNKKIELCGIDICKSGTDVSTSFNGRRLRLYEHDNEQEATYTFNTVCDTVEDLLKIKVIKDA